jgi:transglutaminase-like putative cysteine protease
LGLRGLSVGMALASAVLAVPLWIALPRLSTPVVAAAGSGGGVSVPLAMLTDEVTLDAIGALRGNRSVALRAVFEPPPDEREEIRFKAGTFDRFEGGRWLPSPSWETRAVDWERRLVLSSIPGTGKVRVWRSDLGIPVLPLPLGTVAVQVSAAQVRISSGGTLSLDSGRNTALEYELDRVLEAVPLARDLSDRDRVALTRAELSEEARAIGRRAMGSGSPWERVRRLEAFLAENYEYSAVAVARPANREVEDFLLRDRRGYCEYFASAMVLLLRAEGVPARLVSGFLGGEYSALGGQYVVRQENAHAWVEAWIEGQGWRTFDPTPAVGQPGLRRTTGAANLMAQAWEELVYRWDRYVLGYGYDEQRSAVFGWLRRFLSWRERARSDRAALQAAQASAEAGSNSSSSSANGDRGWWSSAVWPVVALLLATVAFILRRRGKRDASWAYLEARRLAARAGVEVSWARGPLAFRDLVLSRWPEGGGDIAEDPRRQLTALVDAYLGESFGPPGSGLLPAAEWSRRVAALRRGISRRSRVESRAAASSTGS